MILGCIKVPPFEIVETAVINWSGVILNLCPKEAVASSIGPNESNGVKIDAGVAAISVPHLSNKP